jgi:hypothetical protein
LGLMEKSHLCGVEHRREFNRQSPMSADALGSSFISHLCEARRQP